VRTDQWRQPDPIGFIDFEISIQFVIGDDRWLATVATKATLVSDLCYAAC